MNILTSLIDEYIVDPETGKLTIYVYIFIGLVVIGLVRTAVTSYKNRGHRAVSNKLSDIVRKKYAKYPKLREVCDKGNILDVSFISRGDYVVVATKTTFGAMIDLKEESFDMYIIIGKKKATYFKTTEAVEIMYTDIENFEVKKDFVKINLKDNKRTYAVSENEFSNASAFETFIKKLESNIGKEL